MSYCEIGIINHTPHAVIPKLNGNVHDSRQCTVSVETAAT